MENRNFLVWGVLLIMLLVVFFSSSPQTKTSKRFPSLKTDISKSSVDLDLILSGGSDKDDIPALSNPDFVSIEQAGLLDDDFGVLVNFDGQKRFYPYKILVWHEIVNDTIDDYNFSVTFCPLCGSAIVVDRNVDGQILDFGVSGYLYESNLLMYDRQTESLWAQARAEAIVGEYTGKKLAVLDMQLISVAELKQKHTEAQVLSQETGYNRDYSFNPYSVYDISDNLYFPVSISDSRFAAKEIMYSFVLDDQYIAFPQEYLLASKIENFKLNGHNVTAQRDGDEILIMNDGQKILGYYEMWFSWATNHQNDGIVWEIKGECLQS